MIKHLLFASSFCYLMFIIGTYKSRTTGALLITEEKSTDDFSSNKNHKSDNASKTSTAAQFHLLNQRIITYAADLSAGTIGASERQPVDNPFDNIFHVVVPQLPSENDVVYLQYQLAGVKNHLSIARSINDEQAVGGHFVQLSKGGWTMQKEMIATSGLRKGDNVVRFGLPLEAAYHYEVKDVTLVVEKETGLRSVIVVNQPDQKYYGDQAYLKGTLHLSAIEQKRRSQPVQLFCNDQAIPVFNNEFEIVLQKPAASDSIFSVQLKAILPSGEILYKRIEFANNEKADLTYTPEAKGFTSKGLFIKGKALQVDLKNEKLQAAVSIPTRALLKNQEISVTALRDVDVPALGPDMVNVTKGTEGFRFLPHGTQFGKSAKITIAFDSSRIPDGYTADDIRTFYFDENARRWTALPVDTVMLAGGVVVSSTTHFTDMINGIIKVPESPQTQGYTPTSIKDFKAADPAAGITLIAPPSINQMGTANLNYPIQVPTGRHGLSPNLSINYNSGGGNSWMGIGWNLSVPAISIETRWGVPRYNESLETETYTLNGEQLAPLTYRSDFVPRSAERHFYPRIESSFMRVIRHGNNPKNYWWEVTDKTGTRYSYGGIASTGVIQDAVLGDADGNIGYWALVETRDLNDNYIHYKYTKAHDPGVPGGNDGQDLYVAEIRYTGHGSEEGKYSVNFITDGDRSDKQINCRLGFKRVSSRLLRRIEVRFDNEPIRQYGFEYKDGPFSKKLLDNIRQLDAAGAEVGKHSFTYFNQVQQNGQLVPFQPAKTYQLEKDGVDGEFVSGLVSDGDEATNLGATEGTDRGVGLYIGFGPWKLEQSTSKTAGFHFHNSHATTDGRLSLIDINGDGKPDKVFEKSGRLFYRPQIEGGNLFGTPKEIGNAGSFLHERSSTNSLGLSASFGFYAGFDRGQTTSETTSYFTDANGDGLIDIVNGGSVMFNTTKENSDVGFSAQSSNTHSGVNTGARPDTNLVIIDPKEQQKKIDDNPLNDIVRKWTAPADGTIRINAPVHLVEDTSINRKNYTKADGVRVAIQQNGSEIWSTLIDANDYAIKIPLPDSVEVKKGDRVYFRVQSNVDGAFDQVYWNPVITYTGKDTSLQDANRKPLYQFGAADDYIWTGSGVFAAPICGTIQWIGNYHQPKVSDTLWNLVIKNHTDTLFKAHTAADTTITFNQQWKVDSADKLEFRVFSKSNVAWPAIRYDANLFYTTSCDTAIKVKDKNGNYYINSQVIPNLSIYGKEYRPTTLWIASGNVDIAPKLSGSFSPTDTGYVTLSVKKKDTLLGQKTYSLQDINKGNTPPVTVKASKDTLSVEYTADRYSLLSKINKWEAKAESNILLPGVYTVHHPDTLFFGHGYRNWTAFAYNGNRDRANKAIVESDLIPTPINIGSPAIIHIDTSRKDPDWFEQQFTAQAGFDARKAVFIPLQAAPNKRYTGYDEFVYLNRDTISASRMGDDDVLMVNPLANLPAPSGGELPAVPKMSKGSSWSVSVGGGMGLVSLSYSHTESQSKTVLDYADMNGDKYPDILGENNIQFTKPTGGLDALSSSADATTLTESNSDVLTFGGKFPKGKEITSTQNRGSANVTPYTTPMPAGENSKAGGNFSVEASPGISANIGFGSSHTEYSWNDMNGDGLMDKVYEDGSVQLNLGYKFLNGENWGGGHVHEGKNEVKGLGVGVNFENSSFEAGIGVSTSENDVLISYSDVNGDGLADQIVGLGPLWVRLNTGAGFAQPIKWEGANQIGRNLSLTESINAAFTINIPLFPLFPILSIAINPSISFSRSFGKDNFQITDLNGDGYPDYLSSNSENDLTVAYSAIGKTFLLKQITRPLGATIDLDYEAKGNTYEMPQQTWVLKSVDVFDGLKGDGADVQSYRFAYDSAFYNRHEREFYGFKNDTTYQLNTAAKNVVYRTHIQQFHNKGLYGNPYDITSYYTKGLLEKEWMEDAKGKKYSETTNYYELRLVTENARFPALMQTDKTSYEANNPIGITATTRFNYDALGNITQIRDLGDGTPADELVAVVTYHNKDAQYIKSIPKSIVVTTTEGEKRRRTTTINDKGDIIQIQQFLAGGTSADYNMEYDAYGNLSKITRPLNHRGQRMWYSYQYDDVTHSYTTNVTDAFGYTSSSTYDFRFGELTGTTSMNSEPMRYTLDNRGRMTSVTGPYELASGKRYTIAFEYHPEAVVPYAITRHYDPEYNSNINTYSFIDGLGRSVQIKKQVSLFKGKNLPDELRMAISGRVIYDAFGRAVTNYYLTTEPIGAANATLSTSLGQFMSRAEYDVMDRPLLTKLADSATTLITYTIADKQFSTKTTDALGNVKEMFADVRGRNRMTKEYGGPDGVITTKFYYDALDELKGVEDNNNNKTVYEYDNLGRKLSVKHPDAGFTKFEYDLASNLRKKTTEQIRKEIPAGGGIEYSYDYERLTDIDYPRQYQNKVKYTYGSASDTTTSFGKLRAGRLILQEDASGGQEFYYGKLGEVTKVIRTMLINPVYASTYVSEQEYDTWNRIKKMTYPDGEVITYHYNQAGGLLNMSGEKQGSAYNYVDQLGYDEFEQRVYLRYGNKTEMHYAYDNPRRRLSHLDAITATGRKMMNNYYTYDLVSNIKNITNKAGIDSGKLGGYARQDYFYDNLYRLDSASGLYAGYKDTTGYSLKMTYDNLYNVVRKKMVDSTPNKSYDFLYTYGGTAPHQATQIGPFKYKYDLNGNGLGFQAIKPDAGFSTVENFWDEENRLMAVINNGVLSQYTYDAGGERAVKSSGGLQGIWVNGAPAGAVKHYDNYTAYVSPYLVCRRTSFTKHYYIESQRIATKLGTGEFSNISFSQPALTAGSIDYTKRAKDIEKSRTEYYASLGVSPGPPTDKNFWARPENSGIQPPVIEDTTSAEAPSGWPRNTTSPPVGPPIVFAPIPSSDSVKAGYGYRGTGQLYEKDQFFYHLDHLGSTSYISDPFGEVNQHAEYSAYGETFFEEHASSFNTPYLFNAKEKDEETGYYYYGARYYDARVSLWLSIDPEMARYPALSPYNYTLNNPIRFIDPNGRIPTPEEGAKIAEHVYEGQVGEKVAGWTMNSLYTDGSNPGYKAGLYSKTTDGVTEYVMANAGTYFEPLTARGRGSISEDGEQPFGGSEHMELSIARAKEVSEQVGKAELTFVGHSKGGAEAAGNALATNRNALLYNPAAINAAAYGLDLSSYTGADKNGMTAYVVEGDFLNSLNYVLGAKPIDKKVLLPRQSSSPLTNHFMKSVINALDQSKMKEYEPSPQTLFQYRMQQQIVGWHIFNGQRY